MIGGVATLQSTSTKPEFAIHIVMHIGTGCYEAVEGSESRANHLKDRASLPILGDVSNSLLSATIIPIYFSLYVVINRSRIC